MMRPLNVVLLAILALVFLLSMIKPHEASRVLNEKEENLLLSSLRVPAPPWGPNLPTYIPTPSIKASTINQKSFVGHVTPSLEAEDWIKKENSSLRSMKRSLDEIPLLTSHHLASKLVPLAKKTLQVENDSTPVVLSRVMPPPEVEEWIKKKNNLLRSMKRSPVPPLGPNPPTYIPMPNIKASTISQKVLQGHGKPCPAYPQLMVPLGVATN
ncbi:hypothetical protein HYC85_024206 [Camellia sinensis]|uniref:Uncharacterized protein n=1 Tax=Camellia sinensis TaxID=4442 RepID=A0A7J7G7E5_CAMSI|nr:hypothetical protein HYC85_024206 [Camellia sinensis]